MDAGAISITQNLFDVGLMSFACVQLMMRLEELFDIEFPDESLKKSTFETIASITQNLKGLGANYSVRFLLCSLLPRGFQNQACNGVRVRNQ
ncbi:acyl carrier protein [Rhizobium grahamii CCGE 502]|uniref:Acyl carrier protein n=1 Tax=Rhizobium grahamii CCGE 502 TaxID=990285 RepID=S3HGR6_9HYPH|nr:acyl carrier protein [Rhizobium grahamii CCGE 502]